MGFLRKVWSVGRAPPLSRRAGSRVKQSAQRRLAGRAIGGAAGDARAAAPRSPSPIDELRFDGAVPRRGRVLRAASIVSNAAERLGRRTRGRRARRRRRVASPRAAGRLRRRRRRDEHGRVVVAQRRRATRRHAHDETTMTRQRMPASSSSRRSAPASAARGRAAACDGREAVVASCRRPRDRASRRRRPASIGVADLVQRLAQVGERRERRLDAPCSRWLTSSIERPRGAEALVDARRARRRSRARKHVLPRVRREADEVEVGRRPAARPRGRRARRRAGTSARPSPARTPGSTRR